MAYTEREPWEFDVAEVLQTVLDGWKVKPDRRTTLELLGMIITVVAAHTDVEVEMEGRDGTA